MMEQYRPIVSVVMPAYNAERYIGEAIRSVQAQTVTDWELIVIDDGSSDSTREIIQRLAEEDDRIRFLPNKENIGTARTRNRGLSLCTGRYVALLDSDDIWYPEKLEYQLEAIQSENADIVYTSYAIIDEFGKPHGADYIVPERICVRSMLKENNIGCSTVMMSRETADAFRFSTEYYHEDYVLWLEMLGAGKRAVGVKNVLVDYRYYSGSRASNKYASAKRRWHIYRSFMKLSVLVSAYYLICYAIGGIQKYKTVKIG